MTCPRTPGAWQAIRAGLRALFALLQYCAGRSRSWPSMSTQRMRSTGLGLLLLPRLPPRQCDWKGVEVNGDELRSMQAPIKERYRNQPEAAIVTLHAEGRLGEDVTCSIQTGRALVEAGLHPATGGDGLHACSGDMLLQALAACAGVTTCSVATALGIRVTGAVRADGDLDFRGTLGVDKAAPVGFTDIRLSFDLESDASEEELATLLGLTERYCVVFQTLAHSPSLSVSVV